MNQIIFSKIKQTILEILPMGGAAILFGSQARGDAGVDSDWDVLIIVDKETLTTDDYNRYTYPLTVLGWNLDTDINPILYSRKEWEDSKISPFYHNVQKDGIRIAQLMGLTDDERKTLVMLEMEKANRFLRQADKQKEQEEWDMAANRYYYACFHAVKALFIRNGIESHKHASLLRLFGQNFVLTEKVDSSFGPFLNQMEQLRTKADYNVLVSVSKKEIDSFAQPAHDLINEITKMV